MNAGCHNRSVFYTLGDNSSFSRGFAQAPSILPGSEMVDEVCPECGTVRNYPREGFEVAVEGGSMYPDVLGCGAYPFLIVSDRVVSVWREAGISSFHTYPVAIGRVNSKRLRNVIPPHYWRVEVDGRCRVDLAGSGIEVILHCPRCHYVRTRTSLSQKFRLVASSWDGNPLARDEVVFPGVTFCTGLVVDIARQRGLTNFRFEPMDGPVDGRVEVEP